MDLDIITLALTRKKSRTSQTIDYHVCAQGEYDPETGLPTIENPESGALYLVPAREDENNLFNEFTYTTEGWEFVGGAKVKLTNLEDGSASGSVRGILSASEGSNYTMGVNAFAVGSGSKASGTDSFAEGGGTIASGGGAHSEGSGTTASGSNSHAEGTNTVANHRSQHVFGEHNIADPSSATGNYRGNYVEIVGNGTASDVKSNARTLDWNGNETLAGKLTVGTAPTNTMDVATKGYVDTNAGNEVAISDSEPSAAANKIWIDPDGSGEVVVPTYSEFSALESTVSEIEEKANAAYASVGAPLVALTASAMTNTDKVYVYTGSESGYTAGNWYYYDGSAWTSGGVYNAVAVNTDKTLSVENMAADAAAVGDLKDAFSQISDSKNLFDATTVTEGKRLDTSGFPFTDSSAFLSAFIPVTAGITYTKNSPTIDGYHRMATYNGNTPKRIISDSNTVTIASDENALRFCGLLTELQNTSLIGDITAVDSVARKGVNSINALDPLSSKALKVAEENGYAFNVNNKEFWEQGTLVINGSTVTETDSNVRIRTNGYVQDLFPGIDKIKASSGFQIIKYSFNADGSYASLGQWTDEITGIVSASKKMKLVARKNPESDITPMEAIMIGAFKYDISHADNIVNIESYIDTLCESRSGNGFEDIKEKFGNRVQEYIGLYGSEVDGVTKTYEEIYEWLLNRNNCIYNGALHKNGLDIVNSDNKKVVLHGIGTHYLLDYSSLHTMESLETLKYYGINCIRLTAYTADNNFICSAGGDGFSRKFCQGYISLADETKEVMDDLIEKCVELGLYCIVDWHILDGQDARTITTQMNSFFSYFSNKYKNTPNVLYELFNEPFQNTASELAVAMKDAYDIIRANNASAVIVTGIGSDGVANMNSVLTSNGMTDVFISAHYYQIGQGTDVSPYVQNYYTLGYPMFYTEWGNANADGAGTYYDALSQNLMDKFDELGISNCCWKFTYQNMATGTLKWSLLAMRGNGFKYGGFNEVELSHNGKFYFKNYQDYLFRE